MIVDYTRSFDRNFYTLALDLQPAVRSTIERFLESYSSKHFHKGLRAHRCGPFLSLSVSRQYRIYVLPIPNGVKFVFVGNHKDADNYLKK